MEVKKIRIKGKDPRQCPEDCPLLERKKNQVPFFGNKQAKIIFCGESPGIEETIAKQPFSLKVDVEDAGIIWKDLFIANSARCRIDKKRMSGKEITETLKCCRPKFEFVCRLLEPKIIVAIGDIALRQLLKKTGISKHRGKLYWSNEFNCWVFPIFHPAYILRNLALRKRLQNDLKLLKRIIDNNYQPLEIKQDSVEYKDVDQDQKYLEQLEIMIRQWEKNGHTIAIDTETQGLDYIDPNHLVVSYSVSWEKGKAFQVYLFEEVHKNDFYNYAIDCKRDNGEIPVHVKKCDNFDRKVECFFKIMESSRIKKYMMTGYDCHAKRSLERTLQREEKPVEGFAMDIQAAANLLDENLYKLPNLEMLAQDFTDFDSGYKTEFSGTHSKDDMLTVAREAKDDFTWYACADSDVTRRVGVAIKKELMKIENISQARYMVRFTMPTISKSLHTVEKNGLCINQEAIPKTRKEVGKIMEDAHTSALKLINKEVKETHIKKGLKLTRTDFLRDALFSEEGFGIGPVKRTKTGPSVDKEARQWLLDKRIPQKARKLIETYETYLQAHTMDSRYLKGFAKHIRCDGRIHSRMSAATTVTGRIASSDPNLMNIPKRSELAKLIRYLLIASPGYVFLTADASQNELRWAAHVSNDREMIKVFKKGLDIHMNTAQDMASKNWESLGDKEKKKLRQKAKPVNFGIIYLISATGLVKYSKMEYGIEISHKEAERYIRNFFRRYQGLKQFHTNIIQSGKENGYVESAFGRRRHLPEIRSEDRYLRFEAERMAVNHPIQSPASDTVLIASNEIQKKELDPKECRLVMFIHDELIFEVKDNSKIQDYAKLIKREMENPPLKRLFGIKMTVPLGVEVKVGKNLGSTEVLI